MAKFRSLGIWCDRTPSVASGQVVSLRQRRLLLCLVAAAFALAGCPMSPSAPVDLAATADLQLRDDLPGSTVDLRPPAPRCEDFPEFSWFLAPRVIPPAQGAGSFLAAADFDADGRLDLIEQKAFCRGRGDGTFERCIDLDPQNVLPGGGAAVVGDFDSDGRPDYAARSGLVFVTAVFQNLGGGRFALPVVASPTGPESSVVPFRAADYEHDGRLDLAAGSWVFQNHGGFRFSLAHEVDGEPIDIDRDGWVDFIYHDLDINRHDPKLPWATRGVGLSIAPKADYPDFHLATTVDQEGDGDLDVAVISLAESVGTRIGWVRNLGRAGYELQDRPLPIDPYGEGVVGDFDGNRTVDIVAMTQQSCLLALRTKAPGSYDFGVIRLPAGTVATDLVGGDFNGDGRPDLMARIEDVQAQRDNLYLLLNAGR